jgi:two-component system, NarL family, response regulator
LASYKPADAFKPEPLRFLAAPFVSGNCFKKRSIIHPRRFRTETMLQPIATKTIRILIADDHPIVRQGLVSILEEEPDMDIVGEADNGKEAIALFRQHQPDIVLLDLRMPIMGGVEAITTIRTQYPDACIIMLTIYDTDEDIYQGLRAGAKAYLLKDTPCDEILEVIRAVCEGRRYIPLPISDKYIARLERQALSAREQEVLKQIATGKSNRDIGAFLGITEHTVKFHANNLLDKLGAIDRTQAVVIALRQGLLHL